MALVRLRQLLDDAAEKGYGIDKLISDSDYTVRSIALSKKNYYF